MKLFRRWWAYIKGVLLGKANVLNSNTHVIKATFEDARNKLITKIRNINDALGTMISQKETKRDEIEELEKMCSDLELALQGAQKQGNERGKVLKNQGKTKEDILQDPEMIRCRTGYQDIESTLSERRARIKTLEETIGENSSTIAQYQSELQTLKGELEKLTSEEAEHIADVESTKAIIEANEALAGISKENTIDKDLADIRQKRKELRGQAKASQQLAGTDAKRAIDTFIQHARQQEATSKFDSLMEWDDANEKPVAPVEERESSKLPE